MLGCGSAWVNAGLPFQATTHCSAVSVTPDPSKLALETWAAGMFMSTCKACETLAFIHWLPFQTSCRSLSLLLSNNCMLIKLLAQCMAPRALADFSRQPASTCGHVLLHCYGSGFLQHLSWLLLSLTTA